MEAREDESKRVHTYARTERGTEVDDVANLSMKKHVPFKLYDVSTLAPASLQCSWYELAMIQVVTSFPVDKVCCRIIP